MEKAQGRFYRTNGVPKSVDDELRAAAAAAGLPFKRAVEILLRGVSMVEAILVGQRKAQDHAAEATVTVAVHLPTDVKEDLAAAASTAGVTLGSAGRLILISRKGRLAEAIREGLTARLTTATAT